MTAMGLIRPLRAVAWELRAAWATGRRVSITIDGDVSRLEGHVKAIAATDAYTVVAGMHVPLERILAVHKPSRLGDSTFDDDGKQRWIGRVPTAAQRDPRQLSFDADTSEGRNQ